MPNPAFIVEGVLEQRMVQIACPDHKVVLLGVNGDNVSMTTIAARIITHVKLFCNRYHPIVVIFDRERRQKTVPELLQELQDIISCNGLDVGQFHFLISDRDIEVMFLAHLDRKGEFIPTGCSDITNIDGINGEAEVKSRLRAKGVVYHKTTTGVSLFKQVNPIIVSFKSENFRRFKAAMAAYCRWLSP